MTVCAIVLSLLQATAPVHTHGHMVGEVRSSTAVIWTRADRAVQAKLELSTDATFKTVLDVGPVASGGDNTVHFIVDKLDPDTLYHYRTTLIDPVDPRLRTTSLPASFRTAPDKAVDVDFVAACEFYERQSYPLLAEIGRLNPDFFLSLGDLPYADKGVPATDLKGYRRKHEDVHAAVDMQRLFSTVPLMAIFDDHEVVNDWDATADPAIVAVALQAWNEWKPFVRPASGAYHRSFAWGKSLRVILLDTRSLRGSNFANDDTAHSMLGVAQRDWLIRELQKSTETFKVVVTTVPLRSGWKWRDHWAGYQRERRLIFDAIHKSEVTGVVFVSGDHHFSARNHHAEGICEIVLGALDAHHNEPPLERDAAMHEVAIGPCYLQGKVDSTANPPSLQLDIRREGKVLLSETIYAQKYARMAFTAELGIGSFCLVGPRTVRGGGRQSMRTRLPGGRYEVHASAEMPQRIVTRPKTVDVPAGGFLSVGISPDTTTPALKREVLFEDFEDDGLPATAQIVDRGVGSSSSAWFVDGGRLWQSSRIYSGGANEPGTQLLFGRAIGDQVIETRLRSWGPESAGVVLRHRGPTDYYWLDINPRAGWVRFGSRENDKFRELARVALVAEAYRTYAIEAAAIGDLLTVAIDGEEILRLRDSAHAVGRPGLACNRVNLMSVEDFRVLDSREGKPRRLHASFESPGLGFQWRVRESQSAPGAWHVLGGALHQTKLAKDASTLGTNLVHEGTVIKNSSARTRFHVANGGRVGLWQRLDSNGNGYRAWIDVQTRDAAIERFANGQAVPLASVRACPVELKRMHELEFVALGDELMLRVDGIEIVRATSTAYASGRVGLHTWNQSTARFEDFFVDDVKEVAALVTLAGANRQFEMSIDAPSEVLANSAPAPVVLLFSEAARPPVDLSRWDAEGRLLPLRIDALFNASIGTAVIALDKNGQAKIPLRFPNDSSLRGKRIYVGSFVFRPNTSVEMRPLPSVRLELD